MIHSSTLGFSPQPPGAVGGTGFEGLKLSGFSREHAYPHYRRRRSFAVLSGFSRVPGFAWDPYTYALQRTIPSVRGGVTSPSPRRNHQKYGNINRSEEHTSELQSLMRISYAVFCSKKKNKTNLTSLYHSLNATQT